MGGAAPPRGHRGRAEEACWEPAEVRQTGKGEMELFGFINISFKAHGGPVDSLSNGVSLAGFVTVSILVDD